MALLYVGFQGLGAWLGGYVGCGFDPLSNVESAGQRTLGGGLGAVRFIGDYRADFYFLGAYSDTGRTAARSYSRRMPVDLVDTSDELFAGVAVFERDGGFGIDLILFVSLAPTRIGFWSNCY